MNKTRIEWATHTWNPIKGLCPEACWYCYARAIYRRFKLDPKPWLDIAELNMTLKSKVTGARVFVCSTFELFNPVADGQMRDYIFDIIARRPDLTFIILTKRPENIDRPMPDNVHLGVSVTGESMWEIYRTAALAKAKARVKFVSFEPILGSSWALSAMPLRSNWIIAGRLTGHGKAYDPARSTIEAIVEYGKVNGIPIFLKNNLKDIWGGPLIQEFPK